MVLLHSRFQSGTEFSAGAMPAGSVLGASGLNDVTNAVNALILTGSTALIGTTNLGSNTSTLIGSQSNVRVAMLLYNNSGSDIWIGPSGVTNLNGFKIASNDNYEYYDTEVLYGTTLEPSGTGLGDVRWLDIRIA